MPLEDDHDDDNNSHVEIDVTADDDLNDSKIEEVCEIVAQQF